MSGPSSVVETVARLFPYPAPATGAAASPATVFEVRLDDGRDGTHRIYSDGQAYWETDHREQLLASLEWAVNNAALAQLRPRYVMLHAGVVAHPGGAMLLPAASGSGKSTLAAALMLAGWRYLSDEVAVIDPETAQLLPFTKSMCLKRGGRLALKELWPETEIVSGGRRFGREQVWFLPPPASAIPTGAVAARQVVLPKYRPNASTRLEPLGRSDALPFLLGQSFNVGECGADGLGRLVELLRSAECYRLTYGNLGQALELLVDLAEASGAAASDQGAP